MTINVFKEEDILKQEINLHKLDTHVIQIMKELSYDINPEVKWLPYVVENSNLPSDAVFEAMRNTIFVKPGMNPIQLEDILVHELVHHHQPDMLFDLDNEVSYFERECEIQAFTVQYVYNGIRGYKDGANETYCKLLSGEHDLRTRTKLIRTIESEAMVEIKKLISETTVCSL